MKLFEHILTLIVAISAIYWIIQIIIIIRTIRTVKMVRDLDYPEKGYSPKISVIIAARNEEKTIKEAVDSRLRDNYPNLELILIDDRSDDNTPEIIDKMAENNPRVKAVHITELPEGWLGKVHAMHRGVLAATGEWYLFSDADVHIQPGTIAQVIRHCQVINLDHLAIFPEFFSCGFLIDAVIAVFLRSLVVGGRIYRLEKNNSRVAVGSGAFNLVKRKIFEKSKGFEWLRLEVVDDVTLGQMLKYAGARSGVAHGKDVVGVHWYRDFKSMVRGIGRAVAAGVANCSLFKLILVSMIAFLLDMIPFILMIPLGLKWLPYICFFILILELSASIKVGKWIGLPLMPLIFLPVGYILSLGVSLLEGIRIFRDKGLTWRGTFYSTRELKKGRRFRLFF